MTRPDAPGVLCGLCLDFAHLPGLGPCPDCRPDEHLEFVAAQRDESTGKEDAA